jgi:hypothetical protein
MIQGLRAYLRPQRIEGKKQAVPIEGNGAVVRCVPANPCYQFRLLPLAGFTHAEIDRVKVGCQAVTSGSSITAYWRRILEGLPSTVPPVVIHNVLLLKIGRDELRDSFHHLHCLLGKCERRGLLSPKRAGVASGISELVLRYHSQIEGIATNDRARQVSPAQVRVQEVDSL